MPSLASDIARQDKSGYVVAPAGYGKTHLIAEAVAHSAGRQLILTHTYAGVNALRTKLRHLRVPTHSFRLDTIASWSLRLVLAFKKTSGWILDCPSGDDWADLYRAAATLVEREFVIRMLRASYGGIYVDEYQDCSTEQHELMRQLANSLPVRIVGDPLQAIFDFDEEPVNWSRDVAGEFDPIGELHLPERWIRAGAVELGTWLSSVRARLENQQPIDLLVDRPPQVRVVLIAGGEDQLFRQQVTACRYFDCREDDEAVAIFGGGAIAKARSHRLARQVGGYFSSIEEIEGKALFSAIRQMETARTVSERLIALLEFAETCMTGVNKSLPEATKRGEVVAVRQKTRNPDLANAANAYLTQPDSRNAQRVLSLLKQSPAVAIVRRDLFNRMMAVLRKQTLDRSLSLLDAAEKYQTEFRRSGRFSGRRVIGTTLLVKGLQFDHAIVLDAASLSAKELYVAFTRGARSLTILSTKRTLLAP